MIHVEIQGEGSRSDEGVPKDGFLTVSVFETSLDILLFIFFFSGSEKTIHHKLKVFLNRKPWEWGFNG